MARPDSKEIVRQLEAIAVRGHDFQRVFSDWLALSCHALCKNEDAYMELIDRYRDNHAVGERNADHFAAALAAWLKTMGADMQDYLGHIFEERVSHGEKGQYFTPEPLAEMMAHFNYESLESGLPTDIVADIAGCGSGRMLTSAAAINSSMFFKGVDLDINCVRMTSLNLLCRNVDGIIVWGNGLSGEGFGGYRLRHHWMGGVIEEITKDQACEQIALSFSKKVERQVEDDEQMDLGL